MRTQISKCDPDLLIDLIRSISEVSERLRTNVFEAEAASECDDYRRKMILHSIIEDLLNECCINIKSRGYTFIKDAACIVIDMQTLDLFFKTDVYPYIAEKYRVRNTDLIEHSIRNAIGSGYVRFKEDPDHDSAPEIYSSKPTNKKFILHIAQEAVKRYGKYA